MRGTLERFCGDDALWPSVAATFQDALARCLESIPRGRVATCGAVGRALGDVRAARAVWSFVRDHPEMPGVHRIVRADGGPVSRDAADRLRGDGVALTGGRVPASRFLEPLEPDGYLLSLRAGQRRLSKRVINRDDFAGPDVVGGVDAAYLDEVAYVAGTTFDRRLDPIQVVGTSVAVDFPYIPTYLAFRELPAIEAAVKRLEPRPDVLLIDGHGRLHPERFGIACHAGVVLDIPTIGVAKRPLAGRVRPGGRRHSASLVEIDGVAEGYAWTPPGRSRSLFVSAGHRVGLETALDLVQRTTKRGMPEPLRTADAHARKRKNEEKRERGSHI